MTEMVESISLREQAGDDLLYRIQVVDEAGEALDMTGMTFAFVARRARDFEPVISTESSTVTATIVETDVGEDIDISQGSFGVSIDGSVTLDLYDTYEFEAKVTDTLSRTRTVARGYLTFVPSLQ